MNELEAIRRITSVAAPVAGELLIWGISWISRSVTMLCHASLSEAGPTPQPEGARETALVRPIRSDILTKPKAFQ